MYPKIPVWRDQISLQHSILLLLLRRLLLNPTLLYDFHFVKLQLDQVFFVVVGFFLLVFFGCSTDSVLKLCWNVPEAESRFKPTLTHLLLFTEWIRGFVFVSAGGPCWLAAGTMDDNILEMDSDNEDFDDSKLGMIHEEVGESATFFFRKRPFESWRAYCVWAEVSLILLNCPGNSATLQTTCFFGGGGFGVTLKPPLDTNISPYYF